MTYYYRPVPQTGPARSADSMPLAGGWCWFDKVEVLSRTAVPRIMPAAQLPDDVRTALTSPRKALAGLDMSRPQIMGILNTTPDSFSDGGQFAARDAAVVRGLEMEQDGATIIDVGGESTRPGAATVAIDVEIERTAPIVAALRACSDVAISIDTRKAAVAQAAIGAGATLINDVAALTFDSALVGITAHAGLPICLMHAQGDPETMQQAPQYDDVLLDVYDFLAARVDLAVAAGIERDKIIVDPGIGFGKTLDHNLALLRRLSLFHGLGCPILLGASRKRFIGTITGAAVAQDRTAGSLSVTLAALSQGVQIHRVHDTKQTSQACAMTMALMGV